jgi:formamidopyrimidine-DNA glycosylase
MPELPEVEVSRLGITPHLKNQAIDSIVVRQSKLRWDVPQILQQLQGEVIRDITRRAKYLFIELDSGSIVIHLGMSGSLRVLPRNKTADKHDHIDLILSNGKVLRYNDPRRFGCWLWHGKGEALSVIAHLGPEPLTDDFSAEYILPLAKKRRIPVKQFVMDNKVVVGVGNIYANESLFNAKINPLRAANSITAPEWHKLVEQIKQVLETAIKQGGTTLNDFEQPDGKPGYFAQELQVYGKGGEPCPTCGEEIQEKPIGQRNTFWCESCQPIEPQST